MGTKTKNTSSLSTVLLGALLIAILIGSIIVYVYFQNKSEPEFTIQGNDFKITAFAQGKVEFSVEDIVNIELSDTIPQTTKILGTSTKSLMRGNIIFEQYGASKVFLYKNNPPYIIIELENTTVFFNYKNSEKTYGLYATLIDMMSVL